MNVSLTEDIVKLIKSMVVSGKYRTASEVICTGLRLLMERDDAREHRAEEVRAKIKAGLDQLDDGKGRAGAEVFNRLEARIARLENDRDSTRA
jgi:antitoxin ParD1/3/4